jgi:hypothetical protein
MMKKSHQALWCSTPDSTYGSILVECDDQRHETYALSDSMLEPFDFVVVIHQ